MHGRHAILTVTALFLGMTPSSYSQDTVRRSTPEGRASSLQRSAEYRGAATFRRPRLGTFQVSRYDGIRTRSEEIRDILQSMYPRMARGKQPLPTSPIRDLMEQRNLLSPRSALAVKSTSFLGRNLVTATEMSGGAGVPPSGEPTAWSAANAEGAPLPTKRDDDLMNDSIQAKMSDYYDLGVRKFREGDYIGARNYFDLYADIHYDQSRPFVAGLLATFKNEDYNQAYHQLLTALKRAKTLDDLQIDKNAFFKSPQDFERTLNVINLWAKSVPENSSPSMLLAFFSWLNGDRATTLGAIDSAIQNTSYPEEAAIFQKFRDLVTATPTAPTTP